MTRNGDMLACRVARHLDLAERRAEVEGPAIDRLVGRHEEIVAVYLAGNPELFESEQRTAQVLDAGALAAIFRGAVG